MNLRHVCAAVAAGLLLTAGCARPARTAGAQAQGRYRCPAPFNAGGRIPSVLNPAYPRSGLYPASGAIPPAGAPGVTLRMQAPVLVVTYGQALASTGTRVKGSMVTATHEADGWWQAALAAGYTFRLFGPTIPVFGVVPGPVLTGARANGVRYVWMVTQWDAVQTVTVLRGTDALTTSAQPVKLVPAGMITAKNSADAAAYVRQAEAAGWQAAQTVQAAPACGASADHLSPYGARAELKLPLGVPLQLVSPEFGAVVMELTAD